MGFELVFRTVLKLSFMGVLGLVHGWFFVMDLLCFHGENEEDEVVFGVMFWIYG